MLLGEFSVEDYRETVGLTYLFVVFTLFGVVILLNVLIAVVSDSYERSKTGSDILFGTARLEFVAQHEALEEFLRPGTNPLKGIKLVMRRNSVRVLGRLFRWVVLLSLIMTAMVAEMFLVSRLIFLVQTDTQGVVYIITVSTLGTILAIALWIVSRFAFEGIIRSCAPAPVSRGFDYSATYTNKFVERLSGFMFGQRRDPFASDESDGNFNDEWISRAAYMEKVFERSLQKAKNELTSEIRELEQRLYDFKTPSLAIA